MPRPGKITLQIFKLKSPKHLSGVTKFNDMDGRENHLVKVQGVPDYKPPAKNDPRLEDPLKKTKKRKIYARINSAKKAKVWEFEKFYAQM